MEPSSAEEDILAGLAKRDIGEDNPCVNIRNSLARLKEKEDACGMSSYYDEINVVSCHEFLHYLGVNGRH